MTLMEVITTAGGFSPYANKKKITITRNGQTKRYNYVKIERNPDLAGRLGAALNDPRLTVVSDGAENIRDIVEQLALPPADYVLSGIPFFWLPPETAQATVANTHRALNAGGRFVTYQVFYQGRRYLRVHLERCLSTVRSEVDLRNLPPYRICDAIK